MGDDRGVQLGVGSDLGVVDVRVGLLTLQARNRIKIRVAEDRDPDRVDDLELELRDGQRAAQSAAAGTANRAAGEGNQRDQYGELDPHPLSRKHVRTGSKVTVGGTNRPGHAYSP